jgi:hypothetical protein
MVGCTLADFDILIRGERAPYALTASYGGYNANGEFSPNILDPEWHQAYHTLAQSMSFADADAIMAIGGRLWAALMQGTVRDLWIAARADVEQGRVDGLRLRLDLQPPHVSALPWESLYDPDRSIIFAAHPHFALVRVASLYRHVGPYRRPQVQLPLRVLVAAPDDPGDIIDSQREIAEIRQIMANLGPKYVQVEELTGPFSITDLRNKLARVKPTILHFIGHGDPNGLWLWQRGRPTLAPAQSLRSVMERSPSVKLAFLNSCLAGRPARPRSFAGVAEQMMQGGVPSIIAMQYMIRDDVAIDFAHFLYEELLGGSCPGIIDLAMSAARSGLYAANPGDFSFGTPVLWLNRDGGCIFALDLDADEKGKHAPQVLPLPPKAPTLDLQEESEWIDTMVANTDISHLTGELAFLRSKWINYVEELRSLLLQLSALAQQPESPVYEEKVADYRRFKAALLRVKRLIEDANRQI